jgi:membrane associated rhomboid family serine protease
LLTWQRGSAGVTAYLNLDVAAVQGGEVWRLLTYGFLHSPTNPLHIVFNMLALWFAGKAIEERYGTREFVAFYLLGIVFSGVAYVLASWSMPLASAVGASGGISALLVLYAFNWPYRTFLVFFVIPMQAWLAVGLFVALDALVFTAKINTGVAVAAHLGGALFGFLYYQFQWRLTGWVANLKAWREERSRPRLRVYREEPEEPLARVAAALAEDEQLEAKMDAVLEKVARVGIDNLSSDEKAVLQKASEVYRKRRE